MIPINNLARRTHSHRERLLAAMQRVVDRGWYCLGPEVEAFERQFAEYCGRPYCVAVNSGTDALELTLRGVGVASGDRVATVANAGGYSSAAIRAIGAIPVYVEIEPQSLNMSPADLVRVLNQGMKAVIVTHLYGRLAAIEELMALSTRNGALVIEDCAQAHGAERAGKRAGSFGAAACFSFYPSKNLGALGDGGSVVTDDLGLSQRLIELRQYGWQGKYRAVRPGGRNSRMDELQAAVLRELLPLLDEWNSRRRQIASSYNRVLGALPGVQTPDFIGSEHVMHLYVILTRKRDEVRQRMLGKQVDTAVHYPYPDYCQPALCQGPAPSVRLTLTEAACSRVLTLPCFPEMANEEIEMVIETAYEAIALGDQA